MYRVMRGQIPQDAELHLKVYDICIRYVHAVIIS